MRIKEYSQNRRDYYVFDLKDRYKKEIKDNPFLRGMTYEKYKQRYFEHIKINRLKVDILSYDKKKTKTKYK